ncbi:hypothetical protein BOX15_Mlig016131g2 [Macrostomum lignano]|uniref:Neurotransmitter-gated ion-channel transmembrane domain-containing protein n=1 Tax=Macrostomum lignano TaxID=282301 RepID=A0A267GIL4_9PLAT|nr:hypothetical protein BOX15_Mlig016131g2 [Macrostomum lignano]
MRRSASFYLSILVLPCMLLSCLTWVIFWLPPESPAKMQLGMNIFVAFFVLMLLLSEATPSAVKTFPLIGYYYCLNMVMITLSTFLAVIVINLYVCADRHAPLNPLLRQLLVEGLGRLFLVRQSVPLPPPVACGKAAKPKKQPPPQLPSTQAVAAAGAPEAEQIGQLQRQRRHRQQHRQRRQKSSGACLNEEDDADEESTRSGSVEKGVLELKRHLRMYLSRLKEKERRNSAAMEWRTLAIVLDRIFFTSYVLAIMVAIVLLIPRAHPELPYEREDQKYCM